MLVRSALVALSLVLLTGCAASVKRNTADTAMPSMPTTAASKLVLNVSGSAATMAEKDWQGFRQEWKESFEEQAALAGVPFAMQDGAAKPSGEDGTLLSVYVNDYRFMRPGTRYLIGVMGGNAFIDSRLDFGDLRTGASFGSQSANTSSSAWEGVFSPMTNKQVAAIAADVFRQLKGERAKLK
ncbi:MAG TPA: hypothetical protein VNU71_16810 [Burkholderiaceae bacterium]|nr:hypothetical protein [Burkholderiaceae bacterium]